MGDTPPSSISIDARTLQRARDALDVLASDARTADEWQAVADSLEGLERMVAANDFGGVRATVATLEGEATRLGRIAEPVSESEPVTPIPEVLLLRRNRLIHDLDIRLEAPGGETTPDR